MLIKKTHQNLEADEYFSLTKLGDEIRSFCSVSGIHCFDTQFEVLLFSIRPPQPFKTISYMADSITRPLMIEI